MKEEREDVDRRRIGGSLYAQEESSLRMMANSGNYHTRDGGNYHQKLDCHPPKYHGKVPGRHSLGATPST